MSKTILRTPMALVGKCKCGHIVVASLIYGGVDIDQDTTTTLAEIHQRGGEIMLVDTREEAVILRICKCKAEGK